MVLSKIKREPSGCVLFIILKHFMKSVMSLNRCLHYWETIPTFPISKEYVENLLFLFCNFVESDLTTSSSQISSMANKDTLKLALSASNDIINDWEELTAHLIIDYNESLTYMMIVVNVQLLKDELEVKYPLILNYQKNLKFLKLVLDRYADDIVTYCRQLSFIFKRTSRILDTYIEKWIIEKKDVLSVPTLGVVGYVVLNIHKAVESLKKYESVLEINTDPWKKLLDLYTELRVMVNKLVSWGYKKDVDEGGGVLNWDEESS